MSLHIEKAGSGPSLVMLHGWGANSGVWAAVRGKLADQFSLVMIDLPGHGRSGFEHSMMRDIASLADELAGHVGQPATWLGWSLGGMAAMAVAQRHPGKVEALVTVASAPRFLQADDWPGAVQPGVLDEFSKQVKKDLRLALTRFIALQTRGSETQREDARLLKQALLGEDMASAPALEAGLDLLRQTDLRAGLEKTRCPALVIAGERDSLHPLASMNDYVSLLPAGDLHVIKKAGHAPFVSHSRDFVQAVVDFVNGQNSDVVRRV